MTTDTPDLLSVAMVTLGCARNEVDSEELAGRHAAGAFLLVDDPDARGFVHWIVLDLPAVDGELPMGVPPDEPSLKQGRNDFGFIGWGGPCPPSGIHRYRFTLTAIEAPLGLEDGTDGDTVRRALERATVLGRATLTGIYGRG